MSATPLTRPGTRETGDTSEPPLDLRRAWLGRDVSWLEFNQRVLHEALDDRTPLLERAKFLAIFASNLDEFFMKRMTLIRPPSDDTSLAAPERREKLLLIRKMILSLSAELAACYTDVIRPQLAAHGIHLLEWAELTRAQQDEVSAVFDTEISPVLTPLS